MKKVLASTLALGLAAAGCATDRPLTFAETGALIGAASGAVIGAAAYKKNRTKGAVIGAVGGGLAGGAVGSYMDAQKRDGKVMSPLALTVGEPAGIGPEITLQAWMQRLPRAVPPFFVLADPDHLAALAKQLGLAVPIVVTDAERAGEMFTLALPVVPLDMAVVAVPGTPNVADAPAVIESIRCGVEIVQSKLAAALVTNPISKAPLMRAGFPHPCRQIASWCRGAAAAICPA